MSKGFREITPEGRDYIKSEEGTILFTYDDYIFPTRPVERGEKVFGTLTIGTGHTGPDVAIGMTITEKQADALLDDDLDIVEQFIDQNVKVSLNDNQFAVVCSFGFNIGTTALKKSGFLRKLNKGDYDGAGRELAKWNKTTVKKGGKKVKITSDGLTARRAREYALWNTPAGTSMTVSEGQIAEPRATEVGETKGIFDWLGGLFNIFHREKKVDPITNREVSSVQPIERPFRSGINISVFVTLAATLLAFWGIDVPDDVRAALVTVIPVLGTIFTWVISTFFRKQ